ncbi:hypothetical protein Tco_0567752 [Tanacetum coccineum]
MTQELKDKEISTKSKEARFKISPREFEDYTIGEIVSLTYVCKHRSLESEGYLHKETMLRGRLLASKYRVKQGIVLRVREWLANMIRALGTTQAMIVSELVEIGSKLVNGLEACRTQCPYRLYRPQGPPMWYEQPPRVPNLKAHPRLYPQPRLPTADLRVQSSLSLSRDPRPPTPHSLRRVGDDASDGDEERVSREDMYLLRNNDGDRVIASVTLSERPGGDNGVVESDGVVECGEIGVWSDDSCADLVDGGWNSFISEGASFGLDSVSLVMGE